MFGDLPTVIALKRAGRLLTPLAFAILVANSGNAADLRLPISATPRRVEQPSAAEARQQLFEEYLKWLRQHDQ